jgi:hypothetical protein
MEGATDIYMISIIFWMELAIARHIQDYRRYLTIR